MAGNKMRLVHWKCSKGLRGHLVIILCLWSVFLFAQEKEVLRIREGVNSRIEELEVLKSRSNSHTYKTPRQTFMKYIRSILIKDIKSLLETYESDRLQDILSGRSIEQVIAETAKEDWDTFSDITVESFDYMKDEDNVKIIAIISSVRDRLKITEQFILYLVDTSKGWKIKDDQVMSIQRQRLP